MITMIRTIYNNGYNNRNHDDNDRYDDDAGHRQDKDICHNSNRNGDTNIID